MPAWVAVSVVSAQRATAPASGAVRGPVPDTSAIKHARETLRKVFVKEFARTSLVDRQALAKTLVAQAAETKDDAALQYAALVDAVDLASGAGDATTAFAAIDLLDQHFAADTLDLRRQALAKAWVMANTEAESETAAKLALQTADEAAAVDAFDAVAQLATIAESAATKTRQVRVVASVQPRVANLRALVAEFPRVKDAFARLAKNPDDADAHLLVGRFYALHKGQWTIGLPHLAACSDGELRDLAAKEIARPADGLAQTALGDGWWDYAQKSSGLTHDIVSAHAVEWYKNAEKAIQGITLTRIQERIATSAATQPASQPAATAASAPEHMDLLPLVDTDKDAAQGKWSADAQGLFCDSGTYACLRLPYAPADEYDLRVTFVRIGGNGPVAVLLAAHKKAFGFALDVKGEARFESVDKKAAKDNPTVVPVAVSNNHAYTLTIEVRKDRVKAILDDKLLVEYKTDYKDLSRYAPWKLGDNSLCGIGANNARVLFQKIEMLDVTGKGKPAR